MTKIIAVSNHKGGVGKTTSVANIGAGLSYLGKRVLIMDLDPQSSLTQSFGINEPKFHLYGTVKGEYPLTPISIVKNLEIVAANLDLSSAEIEFGLEPGREYILREILEPIKEKYDYIICDCPPSLGLLTINALTAADEIYIPLQAEFLAIKGLAKISEIIEKIKKRLNKDLIIGGVFITQYDSRKVLNRDVAETIKNYFGDKVFKTYIRDNVSIAEAPSTGKDVFRYDNKCYGSQDYMDLCKEILKKDKPAKKIEN